MNKQQLAAKIWESANKMRSKIEANEYKDYILGFIFYKFLSDKEVKYLKSLGYTDADLDTVTEDDEEIVKNVQQNIGYFISYENLFSTWLKLKSDFNVSNVRDALSAFSRLINPSHKKDFDKVFEAGREFQHADKVYQRLAPPHQGYSDGRQAGLRCTGLYL